MRLSPTPFFLALLLVAGRVSAASPWDGAWFLVSQQSHLSDHSFTLRRVAGGLWRYDDGALIYLFGIDGKAYPEPLDQGLTISAARPNARRLDLVERRSGKEVQRIRKLLSADGSRLSSIRTSFTAAGGKQTESATDLREGTGTGLEGMWRERTVDAPPGAASPQSSGPRKPYWVISSGAAGEMTWHIPATGETLTGKADGRARPARGPDVPASETFAWEAVSDRQIEFSYFVNGHLVERATERMADDRKTWTDTLWIPAYPDQKDVRVFERR